MNVRRQKTLQLGNWAVLCGDEWNDGLARSRWDASPGNPGLAFWSFGSKADCDLTKRLGNNPWRNADRDHQQDKPCIDTCKHTGLLNENPLAHAQGNRKTTPPSCARVEISSATLSN